MKTTTKGNVVVDDIQIGDIHYEFWSGLGTKCEVTELPVRDEHGRWTWKSVNVNTGAEISFMVTEGAEHYGPNLYDYPAYTVKEWI